MRGKGVVQWSAINAILYIPKRLTNYATKWNDRKEVKEIWEVVVVVEAGS